MKGLQNSAVNWVRTPDFGIFFRYLRRIGKTLLSQVPSYDRVSHGTFSTNFVDFIVDFDRPKSFMARSSVIDSRSILGLHVRLSTSGGLRSKMLFILTDTR
jgi:hypothetical protein